MKPKDTSHSQKLVLLKYGKPSVALSKSSQEAALLAHRDVSSITKAFRGCLRILLKCMLFLRFNDNTERQHPICLVYTKHGAALHIAHTFIHSHARRIVERKENAKGRR